MESGSKLLIPQMPPEASLTEWHSFSAWGRLLEALLTLSFSALFITVLQLSQSGDASPG